MTDQNKETIAHLKHLVDENNLMLITKVASQGKEIGILKQVNEQYKEKVKELSNPRDSLPAAIEKIAVDNTLMEALNDRIQRLIVESKELKEINRTVNDSLGARCADIKELRLKLASMTKQHEKYVIAYLLQVDDSK